MEPAELRKKLWEYPQLERKITDILSEITSLHVRVDTLRSVKSQALNSMPHGNNIADNTYKAAQMLIDNEYDIRINKLMAEIIEIDTEISFVKRLLRLLTDNERMIIELHYFEGLRWSNIPARMFMSSRKCFSLNKSALEKMFNAIKS